MASARRDEVSVEPARKHQKVLAEEAPKTQTVAVTLNIQVLNLGGDLISNFAVEPTATIRDLKAELVSICDVNESQQTLLHGQDVLDDASRWMDKSIKENEVVTLAIKNIKPLTNSTIREAVTDFCRGRRRRKQVEREYGHISRWNTADVTDMAKLLQYKTSFNEDLSAWNVGNVTSMEGMFDGAKAFNGDLNAWSISNVADVTGMFYNAASFNTDLSAWNVNQFEKIDRMFCFAHSFNSDLSAWNISPHATTNGMFFKAPISPRRKPQRVQQ